MEEIRCVGLIPAEETADPAAGLNVLVMAINHGSSAQTRELALFGNVDGVEKRLVSKSCTLAAGEHAHLYFHIPSSCFAPEFWGSQPEEMILSGGGEYPETSGKLVFIQL